MKCSICTSEIDVQANGYKGGHNAFPLSNGRCCTKCNDTEVVPMRMAFVVSGREYTQFRLFVSLGCLRRHPRPC